MRIKATAIAQPGFFFFHTIYLKLQEQLNKQIHIL